MNSSQGKFISIEGLEGVGKSTAVRYLQALLEHHGISVVLTREPGGTPIAESIRQILLQHYPEPMCADTELLLMFAGRAQNISEIIRPALARGDWVLSDRFTDASFAYQGGGRCISPKHIHALAKWVQKELRPDLTILLDAPVETGLSRVSSRGAKDRIELEGVEFFKRVHEAYLKLAAQEPDRFYIIDARQDIKNVEKDLSRVIKQFIENC